MAELLRAGSHTHASSHATGGTDPITPASIGAEVSGVASGLISTHNVEATAHNDIRSALSDIVARVNALLDSDDTTLDQLSEIVAYIQSNRGLIDSVTTSKVNVTDIIDNLTTDVAGKPLSAAQGVALKALIDAIDIPTVTNGEDGAPGPAGSSGVYIGEEAPTDPDINVWVDTDGTPDPVAKKYSFTATALSTGWVGESAPYSQTINVLGVLSTDKPIVDLIPSDTFATVESEIEGWSFIYDIQTAAGTITLYATDTPTVDLNVQMEVFR